MVDFNDKFSHLVSETPTHLTKRKLRERAECMQEELDEFKKAIEIQDIDELADALIDLVYFAKGTAVQMGLPWKQLWNDVQRANMDKMPGIGKRGHLVDCVKPPGWIGPQTGDILRKAGYDKTRFQSAVYLDDAAEPTICFDERKCLDDSVHLAREQITW